MKDQFYLAFISVFKITVLGPILPDEMQKWAYLKQSGLETAKEL